jgi:hypothetical protein
MQQKTSIRKADAATPFFCARYQDFDLWFEGMGWDLPRTNAMMAGLENSRYADICGDDIGAMDGVGWEFIADPVCFTATHGDAGVVASAWAGPMRTEDDEIGCNLSYAVDEAWQGRSLAMLLSCLAFLACEQQYRRMTFANIETRADNHASLAIARSLGFLHLPEEDFTMPVAGSTGEAVFHCLRADMTHLRHCAYLVMREKKLGNLLALIQAARRR